MPFSVRLKQREDGKGTEPETFVISDHAGSPQPTSKTLIFITTETKQQKG